MATTKTTPKLEVPASAAKPVQTPAIADQALDFIERGLDRSVATIKQVSQTVAPRLPELPALGFIERLPKAEDVVKQAFAVADRFLDLQRDYALKVVDALKPVREKVAAGK